jgi:hypothetical protein
MRTLFVCALAASLVGCSCYAPQTGYDACTNPSDYACFDRTSLNQTDRTSLNQTIDQDIALSNTDSETAKVKPRIAARKAKPSDAREHKRTQIVLDIAKPATAVAKVEPAPSSQPAETSDAAMAKGPLNSETTASLPPSK